MKKRILSMLVLLMMAAVSAVAQLYAPPGGGGANTITLLPSTLTLTVGEEATVSYSLSGGMVYPSWRITEGGSYISFKSQGLVNPQTVIANAPGTATIECYASGWTSGYCTVTVNPANVTLTDGNNLSGLSAYAGKTVDVTYSRSFTSGKTSTVCLPFAFPVASVGGTFYTFTGITKSGSEYIADMTASVSTTLTPNTPYVFMPSATGAVDFSGTYAIPSTLTAGSTVSGDWTFKGTYTGEEWMTAPATPTYGFSASDANDGITQGQFVKVGSYVRVQPMRCYLENASFAGARGMTRAAAEQLPEIIKVRLVGANGQVTGIGSLQTKTGEVTLDNEAWYSLDGRRIVGKPSTKGIYVNNGKKLIIR